MGWGNAKVVPAIAIAGRESRIDRLSNSAAAACACRRTRDQIEFARRTDAATCVAHRSAAIWLFEAVDLATTPALTQPSRPRLQSLRSCERHTA